MRNTIERHPSCKLSREAVMELVFDAARANEKREVRTVRDHRVSFTAYANGFEHEAAVRDADGVVVALAIVDDADV
jgi:hypothetical protein